MLATLVTFFLANFFASEPTPTAALHAVYLSVSGEDTNSGARTSPLKTLPSAVITMRKIDSPGEIVVGHGTHKGEPVTIANQELNIIGRKTPTFDIPASNDQPWIDATESDLHLTNLHIIVRGADTTTIVLSDTITTYRNCSFVSGGHDEDIRNVPFASISGGELYAENTVFAHFRFEAIPIASLLHFTGKSPIGGITNCVFDNISKPSKGCIVYVDEQTTGGSDIVLTACSLEYVYAPVMGGGVMHLATTQGRGRFTVNHCNFTGHLHVSGGILFQEETVRVDPETGLVLPFRYLAFPVLPPSSQPESGWFHSDEGVLGEERGPFYVSSLWAPGEYGRVGVPEPVGIITRPTGQPPKPIKGLAYTLLPKALFSTNFPLQPPVNDDFEIDAAATPIKSEWVGETLHLMTPPRPTRYTPQMPKTIQHVYIKVWEEGRTAKGMPFGAPMISQRESEVLMMSRPLATVAIAHEGKML